MGYLSYCNEWLYIIISAARHPLVDGLICHSPQRIVQLFGLEFFIF